MTDYDAAKDKVSGKVKETAGKLTGDESTEAKGKAQQIAGDVKEKLGEAKDKVAEKFNDVVDKTKKKRTKSGDVAPIGQTRENADRWRSFL
ncbi:hypothetical protein LCAUW1_2347 [Lacticaseibacillus paracasei]|nr:hypothetical protein LCAUW1_2347 [Lacticaseibacillus paracasei]